MDYHLCNCPMGAAEPSSMGRRSRAFRRNQIIHCLFPAVVLVLGLGLQGAAVASSIVAAGPFQDDDHDRYCKCSNCVRESCCCGPHVAKTPAYGSVKSGRTDTREQRSLPENGSLQRLISSSQSECRAFLQSWHPRPAAKSGATARILLTPSDPNRFPMNRSSKTSMKPKPWVWKCRVPGYDGVG